MARKKYKFDTEQKKIYEVDITQNISESSSTPETDEQKKAREEHNARRAYRRATNAQKQVTSDTSENKRYDILAQYHQLNYSAIQSAVKELNVKPKIMTNTYLVILDVDAEEFDKIKQCLLKCHFETEAHKQYKVRVAGYKHHTVLKYEKSEKKPTTNTAEKAAKAKCTRKQAKKDAFVKRKTKTTLASMKAKQHKPGAKDTSNTTRKIAKRIKKACKYLAKKESMRSIAKKRVYVKKPKQKATQGTLKFAA